MSFVLERKDLTMSSIGASIDKLFALREKKRGYEELIKEVEKQYAVLESELMLLMKAEGVDKATGKKASTSITTSIRPNVENWDDFYRYIGRTKYFHLLERRPSVTGCRELFETKGKIPGVVPFTKESLNLRTI